MKSLNIIYLEFLIAHDAFHGESGSIQSQNTLHTPRILHLDLRIKFRVMHLYIFIYFVI